MRQGHDVTFYFFKLCWQLLLIFKLIVYILQLKVVLKCSQSGGRAMFGGKSESGIIFP